MPVAVLKPATPANPTATADIYYIHADHLGTPRKITRPNDNRVVWSWESEAFGNSLPDPNPSGLGDFVFNLRFPGQYYDQDQETGLFYNYFRDYDPAKGRYIESDPIGLAAGINTYTYVGGNPVNFIDPLGLAGETPKQPPGIPTIPPPERPKAPPPKGPGTGCKSIFEACIKGAQKCGPLKKVAAAGCFALWLTCEAANAANN